MKKKTTTIQRTLIAETPQAVGKNVKIAGWIQRRRDHGKLTFLDVRDRSGVLQVVSIPDKKLAYKMVQSVRAEFVVELEGLVKERPGGAGNAKLTTGAVEMDLEKIRVIAKPEVDLPVDVSAETLDLQLDTLLTHRTIALRHEKNRAIFKMYAELLRSYAETLRQDGFLEIKTPKIMSNASEGGANFFKIAYFDREAFLAQSPQFYKQAGVGIFERVFEIGTVFRAEPHFTTRHVNEYVSLDAEMGFIEGVEDVIQKLETVVKSVMMSLGRNCEAELAKFVATVPEVKTIPRIPLPEALKILEASYGKKMDTVDIDPEGERLICDWVKKAHDSDFVFLTRYPSAIRPFYAMPSGDDPQFTESFDLLFRGVEIATGGQRIHSYEQLVDNMKKRGLNPEDFYHYLDVFRYGIPPHGGWGMGSERIIQQLLGLGSIKEAVLWPRDVKRIAP